MQREKAQVEKTPVMANLLSNAKNSIDYLTFACYLLFLLTLEKDEISGFIFWLYFRSKGDRKEFEVSQAKLIELANLLGKSKKEHEKKALKRQIKALEKMTKSIDPAYFKRGKFHLLDLKCGQPFTRPLINVQNEIKKAMLSNAAWMRISKNVHDVMQNLLPAKKRLVDPKNTMTYTHYKNTGDRKRARKELAPYVKLLSEFSVYLSSDDDTLVVQKTSIFSCLFGWMFKSREKKRIVPTKTWTENEEERKEDQMHVHKEKPKIDHLDLTAMTYRYRRQMRLPIHDVYEAADQRRDAAEELILKCEEDVLSGDELAAKMRRDDGSDNDSIGDDVDDEELNAMMEQFEVKLDENGEIVLDEDGQPVLIPKETSDEGDMDENENDGESADAIEEAGVDIKNESNAESQGESIPIEMPNEDGGGKQSG